MDLKYTLAAAASLLVIPLLAAGCTDQPTPQSSSAATTIVTTLTPTSAASGLPSRNVTIAATPRVSATAIPTPTATATKTVPVNTNSKAKQTALAQLKTITVAEANYGVEYNRTADFGPAWADLDNNGCDTRNDILKRDLTDITYRSNDYGCTIATGTLRDEYTGKTIQFTRGVSTSMAVQIDHRFPLLLAYQHGADKWSQAKREAYANDPDVLVAVDGPSNGQKSASGPADWMPLNTADWCNYVEKFTNVAAKYDLTLSRRDAAKIRNVLDTCN